MRRRRLCRGSAPAARRRCCSRRPTRTISRISSPRLDRGDAGAGGRPRLQPAHSRRRMGRASSSGSARALPRSSVEPGHRVRAGAGAPDVKVARAAAEAGIAGLSFLRGIPGAIGGALRMNGGAYGGETKDVLVEARGVDAHRRGGAASPTREMGFTYRHSRRAGGRDLHRGAVRGPSGRSGEILAEMNAITEARSSTQPVNTRTGGSTFKNPPGRKAWELVDEAGCRGLRIGDAQVSEMHCNFLINHGSRHRRRYRGSGRGGSPPRPRDVGRGARMGNQAGRDCARRPDPNQLFVPG